jgi:uncharacterized membrane protein YdjX (TVP38/TMEM64 family)
VLVGLILLHSVVFFPAEIVNATAGLVYGFWVALPLVMAAWAGSLLLVSRLVPFVPLSLVGYIAGSTRVPVRRYTWTSLVGMLPITAAAVYLGNALDSLSASDPLLWGAVTVFVVLAASTVVVTRRLPRAPRP